MKVDKKTKWIIVLGISVIVLLIFEMFIYQPNFEDKNSKLAMEQLNMMQSVTVEAEQKEVYDAINKLVGMLNNKEYENLYYSLKDDYREYLFSDYNNFQNYMLTYRLTEYVPNYTSYYRNGNRYTVILEFLKKEYTREDLIDGTPIKYDIITFEKVGENDYRYALGNFMETTSYDNATKSIDGLQFTIMRSTRYAEKLKVTTLIQNNTNESIYLTHNNVKVNITNGNAAVLSSLPVTAVKAGESFVMDSEVYLKYDSYKGFEGCTFTGIKSASDKLYEDVTINIT